MPGLFSLFRRSSMAAKLTAIDKAFATIDFSLDGHIITANENFLATVGYTLDEVRGKHHSMFLEPGARGTAEYEQFWRDLNRGEVKSAEFRRLGKVAARFGCKPATTRYLGERASPSGL